MPLLLKTLAIASAGLGLLTLFVLPSRTAGVWIGDAHPLALKYANAGLLAYALGVIFFWALSRLWQKSPKELPLSAEPRTSRNQLFLFWSLATVLLVRVALSLDTSLQWDENEMGVWFTERSLWDLLNPFFIDKDYSNINQPIASLASYVTTKILGTHEVTLRLPALGFTGLFVWALWRWGKGLLFPLALPLLLAHLCVNELSLWYFHSLKGYASLIAFGTIPLLILLQWTQGVRTKNDTTFFLVGCVLTLFSHTFGALHLFFLLFATTLWCTLQKQWNRSLQTSLMIGLCLLPLMATILLRHAILMQQLGNFFGGAAGAASILPVLGISRLWLFRLVLVGIVALAITSKKREFDLLALYLLTTAVLLSTLMSVLGTETLAARYFLVFLPALLLWIGKRIDESRFPRSAMAGALALFIGGPLLFGPEVKGSLLEMDLPFDRFINKVRAATKNQEACFSFSGEPHQVRWANKVYLNQKPCNANFHIHFKHAFYTTQSFTNDLPKERLIETILTTEHGRTLYRLSKN